MLKNAALDAKIGFDPAENEPPNLGVLGRIGPRPARRSSSCARARPRFPARNLLTPMAHEGSRGLKSEHTDQPFLTNFGNFAYALQNSSYLENI